MCRTGGTQIANLKKCIYRYVSPSALCKPFGKEKKREKKRKMKKDKKLDVVLLSTTEAFFLFICVIDNLWKNPKANA
jgi:hypothetical protein